MTPSRQDLLPGEPDHQRFDPASLPLLPSHRRAHVYVVMGGWMGGAHDCAHDWPCLAVSACWGMP